MLEDKALWFILLKQTNQLQVISATVLCVASNDPRADYYPITACHIMFYDHVLFFTFEIAIKQVQDYKDEAFVDIFTYFKQEIMLISRKKGNETRQFSFLFQCVCVACFKS